MIKIKSAVFVTSAVKPSQYPDSEFPEVAFAGKSNVGKSSLINTLVNRKRLVKTSSTPGRTQLINFFNINEEFSFVDLPGYGFAKVPVRIKKDWGPMIDTYLSSRPNLMGVVLIIDLRRTPGKLEKDIIDWLNNYDIPFSIVVTKADKLSKNKQIQQLKLIAGELLVKPDTLTLFSAKTRLGKEKVWEKVIAMIKRDTTNE